MAKVARFQSSDPRPPFSVDTVLWTLLQGKSCILLIQRKHDTFGVNWARPGGFVADVEPLADATCREGLLGLRPVTMLRICRHR